MANASKVVVYAAQMHVEGQNKGTGTYIVNEKGETVPVVLGYTYNEATHTWEPTGSGRGDTA